MDLTALRAVLFDFDGTLADSYAAIASTVNHIRAHHGLAALTVAEVRVHVGRGPENLILSTVPGCDVQRDLQRYRVHHPTVMRQNTHLLPGAREALEAVKQSGRRVAICSNKPRAYTAQLVECLEITPLLDLILGPEDVAQVKPAPDMLLKALERMQLVRAEVLYVGDMAIDVQTARAAGVAVWTVPTGSDSHAALEAAHPDRLLSDLHEFSGLLARLA